MSSSQILVGHSRTKAGQGNTPWQTAAMVLLGIAGILMLFTFRHYGITWDEEHSSTNGKYFLSWYASGFQDRSIIDDNNQRLYGSFFNGVSRLIAEHSPLGLYETGHLMTAIVGWLGLFYAYRMGTLLLGPAAGFLSALILILTPAYFGHSFNNPKDIPFAVLFLISIYHLLRASMRFPKLDRGSIIAVGISIGLTLGIRVGAVFLFGYYFVLAALWAWARSRENRKYRSGRAWKDASAILLSFAGIIAIAWAEMIVWWPYAQISPIRNPLEAIRSNARFSDWPFTDLYGGNFIRASELPWHYLPTWFAITLPEFYFWAFAAGGLAFLWKRKSRKPNHDLRARLLFLVFVIIIPAVTAVLLHSILYDANRHFLFILAPMAVLAGCSLAEVWKNIGNSYLRNVVLGIAGILAVTTLSDMVRLHPYEAVYFNRAFGGLSAAFGQYETDYWGSSHKEGLDWLIQNYHPEAAPQSVRVANTSAEFQTSYYVNAYGDITRRFKPVAVTDFPNVVLSTTRWNRHQQYSGQILHVVTRMGTPLLYVIEVKAPS